MRAILLLVIICLAGPVTHAQLGKKLKGLGNTAGNTADNKANEAVSDGVSNKLDNLFKKKDKKKKTQDVEEETEQASQPVAAAGIKSLKSYSKFDFVPGEKVIYAESFESDAIGEMPLNWNTSGKGELMQLDEVEGKWLRGFKESKLSSINTTELGEDYTIEFDLIYFFTPKEAVYVMPDLRMRVLNNYKSVSGNPRNGETSFTINIHPKPEKSTAWVDTYADAPSFQSDNIELPDFANQYNKVMHYSIQVQKKRLRVWIDQYKVFDMPQVIETGRKMARISFELGHASYREDEVGFFVSNIRFATGAPDTRHKLLEEGKFSTTGILFAVNSADILPQSYGVLKEIAGLMKQHPDLKVRIVGHTSSDGQAAHNQALSEKRATAVSAALKKDFDISADRMQTQGKGDTQPAASNTTQAGRVQNRRVEFIKI